jgi:hypothetical protein
LHLLQKNEAKQTQSEKAHKEKMKAFAQLSEKHQLQILAVVEKQTKESS